MKIVRIDEQTQALIRQNLALLEKKKIRKNSMLSEANAEYMRDNVQMLIMKQVEVCRRRGRRNIEIDSHLQHSLANLIMQQLLQSDTYSQTYGIKKKFMEYMQSAKESLSGATKEEFNFTITEKIFVGALSHALVNRYFQRPGERRFFMYPLTASQI